MFPLAVSVLLCPLRILRIKGMSSTFEARLQWDCIIPHRRCVAANLASPQFQIASRKRTEWKFVKDRFRRNATKGFRTIFWGLRDASVGQMIRSAAVMVPWGGMQRGPFVLHNLGHSEVQDQQIFFVFLVSLQ